MNRTEIRNTSQDVVWIIDDYEWRSISSNPKIALFRLTVAELHGSGLMTLEPGMAVDLPANVNVHLRLDGSVQSAWATYEALTDAAAEQGVDLIDEAVKKRRTVPAMMYTCFRAGWEIGKVLDDIREDPDQQLRAAVFLDESEDARDAGVNCAEQVRQVAGDAERTNQAPPIKLAQLQAETRAGTVWSRRFQPFLTLAARKLATRGHG